MARACPASVSGYWQDDKAASSCPACNSRFGLLGKKVHCHNCGFIFCSKCCRTMVHFPFSTSVLPQCDLCTHNGHVRWQQNGDAEAHQSARADAEKLLAAKTSTQVNQPATTPATTDALIEVITGLTATQIKDAELDARPVPDPKPPAITKERPSLVARVFSGLLSSTSRKHTGTEETPEIPIDYFAVLPNDPKGEKRGRTRSDAELEADIEYSTRTIPIPTTAVVAALDGFASKKAVNNTSRAASPAPEITKESSAKAVKAQQLRKYRFVGAYRVVWTIQDHGSGGDRCESLSCEVYFQPKAKTFDVCNLGMCFETLSFGKIAAMRLFRLPGSAIVWIVLEMETGCTAVFKGEACGTGAFRGALIDEEFFGRRVTVNFEMEEDPDKDVSDEHLALLAMGLEADISNPTTTRPTSIRSGLRFAAKEDIDIQAWISLAEKHLLRHSFDIAALREVLQPSEKEEKADETDSSSVEST